MAHHVEMLRHRYQADIGEAEKCRQLEAGRPQPIEARFFRKPRRQWAVRGHDMHETARGDLLLENFPLAHAASPRASVWQAATMRSQVMDSPYVGLGREGPIL